MTRELEPRYQCDTGYSGTKCQNSLPTHTENAYLPIAVGTPVSGTSYQNSLYPLILKCQLCLSLLVRLFHLLQFFGASVLSAVVVLVICLLVGKCLHYKKGKLREEDELHNLKSVWSIGNEKLREEDQCNGDLVPPVIWYPR